MWLGSWGMLGMPLDATGYHWMRKKGASGTRQWWNPKAVQAKHLKHLTRKKSAVYLAGRLILGDLA